MWCVAFGLAFVGMLLTIAFWSSLCSWPGCEDNDCPEYMKEKRDDQSRDAGKA